MAKADKPTAKVADNCWIECARGTYVARLRTDTRDRVKARRVVTAWKGPLFRGAFFTFISPSGERFPMSLTNVCMMFDVATPTSKAVKAEGTFAIVASPPVLVEAPKVAAEAPKPAKVAKPKKTLTIIIQGPTEATIPATAATTVAPAEAPKATPPAPTFAAPSLTTSVYTIGLQSPRGLSDLVAAVKNFQIRTILDTRRTVKDPQHWEKLGDTYRHVGDKKEAILFAICEANRKGACVLLRGAEAPGESLLHLEIAQKVKVAHIFRDELIDGAELQLAIDADAEVPAVDHEYECQLLEAPARAEVAA